MRFGNGSNKKRPETADFRTFQVLPRCELQPCFVAFVTVLLSSVWHRTARHTDFQKTFTGSISVHTGRSLFLRRYRPKIAAVSAQTNAERAVRVDSSRNLALLLPKTTQTHAFPSKPADKSPFVCRKQRRNIRNIHKKEVVGPRKHKSKIANRKLQKNTRIASNRNICEERRQR